MEEKGISYETRATGETPDIRTTEYSSSVIFGTMGSTPLRM